MARPKGSTNKKLVSKQEQKESVAGLGDAIKKFTSAMGIKACEQCNARARFLNKAFPFNTEKREMTQDQFDAWKVFKESEKKIIKDEDMTFIEDTYNAIYHTQNLPCRTCGGQGWLQLVKGIDSIYNTYL